MKDHVAIGRWRAGGQIALAVIALVAAALAVFTAWGHIVLHRGHLIASLDVKVAVVACAAILVVLGLLNAFVMHPSGEFAEQNVQELSGGRARMHALERIAAALEEKTGAPVEAALALGAGALGLEYGYVAQVADGTTTVQYRLAPDNTIPLDTSLKALSIAKNLATHAGAYSVDDIGRQPYAKEMQDRGLRWKSSIGTRVLVESASYGAVMFFGNDVRKPGFGASDRDFVELIGTLIGSALGRMRLETELRELASHDPLTGLANRPLFEEYLTRAIGEANRARELVAVHFLGLNHFKTVNDEHGRGAGDAVLREAARRFCAAVRAHDVVARIGGDEFVVMQTRAKDDAPVQQLAQRLNQSMSDAIALANGATVTVGVSVGTAIYPLQAHDTASLLRVADIAMYREKDNRPHDIAQ